MAQQLVEHNPAIFSGGRVNPWTFSTLFLLLAIAAALRLYELGRAPLWVDEQCQLWVASKPVMSDVWEATRVSGPIGRLSYLDSALIWRVASQTRSGFRLPAVFEGIAAVVALFALGRAWFSVQSGMIAAALLSVSGLHVLYSREARGYSLFCLLTILLAIAFSELAGRPGWLRAVFLTLITALTLGVHPLAALPCMGLALGAIAALVTDAKPAPQTIWARSASWTAGAMIAGGCAIYLVCYRVPTVTSLSPMPPANGLLYDIADVYKALVGGYWGVASYAVAGLCVVGAAACHKRTEWRWPACLCLGIAATAAVPVLSAHYFHSWVTPRYSIFAMPFLFLLAAVGVESGLRRFRAGQKLFESPAAVLIAPVFALLLLGSMWIQGRSPYDLEKYKKTDANWPNLEHA